MKTSPYEVFITLFSIILFLLFCNILGLVSKFYFNHDFVYGLVPLFDFDTEKNIPTLYSSVALLFASTLLANITLTRKRNELSYLPWLGLTIIFLFLSMDEFWSIHEKVALPSRKAFNASGLLYFSWVIPYGFALIVFVLAYLKFLSQLPKKIMVLFIISGLTFVSGAIGFELFGGRHVELYGANDIIYCALYTCEEFLEMLGIAIFIFTLSTYTTQWLTPHIYFKNLKLTNNNRQMQAGI